MTITYEFGGDDYHSGDDFEYEVEYDQRVEAIADYMADNYIHHIIQKHKPSSEQVKKLRHSKKILADAFAYTLKDFDLVTDEVEDDMVDIIKEYWEEDAQEQWNDSKY
jgi:putative lipoic acid-binding regulatory protein